MIRRLYKGIMIVMAIKIVFGILSTFYMRAVDWGFSREVVQAVAMTNGILNLLLQVALLILLVVAVIKTDHGQLKKWFIAGILMLCLYTPLQWGYGVYLSNAIGHNGIPDIFSSVGNMVFWFGMIFNIYWLVLYSVVGSAAIRGLRKTTIVQKA